MNLKELFRRKEPWDYVTEYTQRMEPVQAPGELPDLVGAVHGRQERLHYNDMRPDPGWGCGTISILDWTDSSHIANGCITANKIAGQTYRKCLFCGSGVEGRGNCPRCGAPES